MKQRELPLTIVVDRAGQHTVMVGPYIVKGVKSVSADAENRLHDPWKAWGTERPEGMVFVPSIIEQRCTLETSDFHVNMVEHLSDATKPAWFLRLRSWWHRQGARVTVMLSADSSGGA